MGKESVVETSKLVLPSDCSLDGKSLLGGQLLKWLDIIACLAAEKHAGIACVTASADDLHIERTVRCGQVLNLRACVNRAFNTSMEVEVIAIGEDLDRSVKHQICKVYFTFVTQPDEKGNKRYLPPLHPESEEEKTEYYLANERKSMRLEYRKSLQEMRNNPTRKASLYSRRVSKATAELSSQITSCESIEIVLPEHGNHHGTTFGGQLMAWMEQTASISARRLCCRQASLIAVDEVVFRGPSRVGDRIVIKSIVNNTFHKSMEVGARVEAYEVGGATRHIESAYFTYVLCDEDGTPISLPKVISDVEAEKSRMRRALKRVRLRQDRKMILDRKSSSTIAVPWSIDNHKILSYKSIYELWHLQSLSSWKLASKKGDVILQYCLHDGYLCARFQMNVPVPASKVYNILCQDERRAQWDPLFVECEVIRTYHEGHDAIMHIVLRNLQPGSKVKCDDMVLLVSKRSSLDAKDPYTIAYRSISLDEKPTCPEYNRKELLYINKLSQETLEYAQDDLDGKGTVFFESGECLWNYLVSSESQS